MRCRPLGITAHGIGSIVPALAKNARTGHPAVSNRERTRLERGWATALCEIQFGRNKRIASLVFDCDTRHVFSNVDKEEFEMRATVALLVVFGLMLAAGGQDKSTPQGWTAKTIQWQTTSPDGTK